MDEFDALVEAILESTECDSWRARLSSESSDGKTRAGVINEIREALSRRTAAQGLGQIGTGRLRRLEERLISLVLQGVHRPAPESTRPEGPGDRAGAGWPAADVDETLLDRLPYPVALTVQRLARARAAGQDAFQILAGLQVVFEAAMRYLVAVMLNAYRDCAACTPANNETLLLEIGLIRPSLGSWEQAARQLGAWLPAGADPPADLAAALFVEPGAGPQGRPRETALLRSCREFVQYRNAALKRGPTRPQAVYEVDLRTWLPKVRALIDGVASLSAWPLALVTSEQSCRLWMGASPPQRTQPVDCASAAIGHFVLLGPGAPDVLRDLFPFICFLPAAEGSRRLHYYDSVYRYQANRKEAKVLEFDEGDVHPSPEPISGLEEAFTAELLATAFNVLSRRLEIIESRAIRLDELVAAHADIVGRRSAIIAVRRFIESKNSGTLIIQAQPGMGKTALQAHLIRHTFAESVPKPVYFFYRRTTGATDPDACVRGLYAALMKVHGIQEAAESRRRDDPESMSLKLSSLLERISETLAPGRRQLIFIDALDEAVPTAAGKSAFVRLPENLPAGVYVIATTRPVAERTVLARREALEWLELDAPDAFQENVRDGWEFVRGQLAPQGIAEETQREIARIGNGNFQVIRLVCRRISAQLAPAEVGPFVRQLATNTGPDLLGFIYQEFWERATGGLPPSERQLICDVAGTLVTAFVPVTAEMVSAVLGLRSGDWDLAFRKLAEYLEPITIDEEATSRTFYRVYHNSFADFVRTKVAVDRPRYHERLGRFGLQWSSLPAGSGREYALGFAAAHLVEAGDAQSLSDLVRGGFLRAKADALGTFEALLDGDRIAQALAERPGSWSDLLECADQYCSLADELRGEPRAFERMIEMGQVARVVELIQNDDDLFRRGLFMMIVSPWVERRGDVELAAGLQTKGAALVAEQLQQSSGRPSGCGRITAKIAEALVVQGLSRRDLPVQAPGVAPSFHSLPPTDVPARSTIPPIWVWFGHLGVLFAYGLTAGPLCAVCGFAYWAFGGQLADEFLPASLLLKGVAAVEIAIGWTLFVVAWVALFLTPAVRRLPLFKRLLRTMSGLRRQFAQTADAETRRALVERVAHLAYLFRDQKMPESWHADAASVVREGIEVLARDPSAAAGVVFELAAIGRPYQDVVASEIARLDPTRRTALVEALAHGYPGWRTGGLEVLGFLAFFAESASDSESSLRRIQADRAMLEIVARSATESTDPRRLLDFLANVSLSEKGKRFQNWPPVASSLSEAPPFLLRRLALESLSHDRLQASPVVRLAGEARRYLASRSWEMRISLVVLLFPMAFLFAFLAGLLAVHMTLVLTMGGLMLLPFYRRYDPYGVGPAALIDDARQKRRFLAERLATFLPEQWQGLSPKLQWPLAPLAMRRIRDLIVAQAILRKDAYCFELLARKSILPRINRWLTRENLVNPAQVVLSVMGDRTLFESTIRREPRAPEFRPLRQIDESHDAQALDRALPLAPARRSLCCVLPLSLLGTLVYVSTVASGASAPTKSWVQQVGVWEALAVCLVFPLCEHLRSGADGPAAGAEISGGFAPSKRRPHRWTFLRYCLLFACYAAMLWFPLAMIGAHDYLLQRGQSSGFPVRPAPAGVETRPLLAIPYVIAAWLAPSLIAAWRSGSPFDPSPRRLWIRRLKAMGLAVACCVALGGLTRIWM